MSMGLNCFVCNTLRFQTSHRTAKVLSYDYHVALAFRLRISHTRGLLLTYTRYGSIVWLGPEHTNRSLYLFALMPSAGALRLHN